MSVTYFRSGGWQPPRDNETLQIDNGGEFTMWRSIGWAAYPPTPVGRFKGKLAKEEWTALQSEIAAATSAGDLQVPLLPDSAVEEIELDGDPDGPVVEATLGSNARPPGPWLPLVERLRGLLGSLTSHPMAAIALEVEKDGSAARLVHKGDEPIEIDLSDMTVRAIVWEGWTQHGDWHAPQKASGNGNGHKTGKKVSTGWSYDLPFEHGLKLEPGYEVVAYVTFGLSDGEEIVPVSLESPREFGG